MSKQKSNTRKLSTISADGRSAPEGLAEASFSGSTMTEQIQRDIDRSLTHFEHIRK